MKVELVTARVRHRITDAVRLVLRVHNDSAEALSVCAEPLEIHYFVNGREEHWRKHAWNKPPLVSVPAGETAVVNDEFELSFHSLFKGVADIEPFEFRVDLVALIGGETVALHSPAFALEADFRQTRSLPTPEGNPSHYVVDGNKVVYVSSNSRAYEGRARVIASAPAQARLLSESYLVDDGAVYRDGRLQRGVTPQGFRIFNAIYAGNAQIILTSYGDAKVEEPESFETLDAADNYHLRQPSGGYRAGFARDRRFVYFFDESTSTKHAVRLKACKNPGAFVALSHGYGRDDQNVYCESNRIKGADPKTWRLVSRWFSRDVKRAYYGVEPVADVDLASFDVVEDPRGDEPFESLWARDVHGYFERGVRRSEVEWLEARDEARRRALRE